jgi:hypothetical protein
MHAGGGCASRAHRAAPCAAATLARSRCPSELVSRHGCRGEGGAPARCHPASGRKFLDGVRCAAATPDTAATSSAAPPVAQRLSIPVGGREVRTVHAGHHQAPPPPACSLTDAIDAQIILETGEIGRQAAGAVMATDGETVSHPAPHPRPSRPSSSPCPHPCSARHAHLRVSPPQMVYTTACYDEDFASDGSFAPLQVHYSERFSAAGRTA